MNGDNVNDRSADDAVFETLLAESLGGPRPPDLSVEILRRLDWPAPPVHRASPATARRRSRTGRWVVGLAAIATAASIVLAIRWGDGPAGPVPVAVDRTVRSPAQPDVLSHPGPSTSQPVAPARTLTPPAVAKVNVGTERAPDLKAEGHDPGRVATSFDQRVGEVRATLVAAWKRNGVTAQPVTEPAEVAGRLRQRLGAEVDPAALASANALNERLSSPGNRHAIAVRLLGHWGVDDAGAADRLAASLDGGADEVMADWFKPGGRWAAITEAMPEHQRVTATAAAALNVDLRCSRCHDGLVGLPDQADYWSFAAALQNPATGLFYDRLDGRRQVSGTRVRGDWVAPGGESLTGDWIDRRRLASGIASAVWEILHGGSLRPSAYDLSSVPPDGLGDRIEAALADDLLASGFDVIRLVAIVATGGAIDRQIPPELLPGGLLIATEDQVREAMHAVDAFAAGSVPRPAAADQRITMVRREIDRRDLGLDAAVPTALAQIGSGSDSPQTTTDAGDAAVALVQTGGMTAPGWWTALAADQRIDHLAYLAGLDRLDRRQRDVLERLQVVSEDPSLFLQQAWWMIHR